MVFTLNEHRKCRYMRIVCALVFTRMNEICVVANVRDICRGFWQYLDVFYNCSAFVKDKVQFNGQEVFNGSSTST